MAKPVLLKVGGSVVTDKAGKPRFKKSVAKRIFSEVKKSGLPVVLFHGAGSFGHPIAKQHGLGRRKADPAGVSATLAAAGSLHASLVEAAREAGLLAVSVPLHLTVHSEDDTLIDLPVQRIQRFLDEGFVPVLSGTVVRDDELGWRVASADEILQTLAPDLDPRVAVFATDVDGVHATWPSQEPHIPVLGLQDLATIDGTHGVGDDVTGRMRGKLERAFQVAAICPTWIVNGTTRGRILDVLKGKTVPGTRLQA